MAGESFNERNMQKQLVSRYGVAKNDSVLLKFGQAITGCEYRYIVFRAMQTSRVDRANNIAAIDQNLHRRLTQMVRVQRRLT